MPEDIQDRILHALYRQRFNTKLRDFFISMIETGKFEDLEETLEVKIGGTKEFFFGNLKPYGDPACLFIGYIKYKDLLDLVDNRDVFYIDKM